MTTTSTRTDTHWHTQWRRRDAFLEDARANQRRIVRGRDLRLEAMKREKWPTPTRADGLRGPDYAKLNREGSGGDDLVTAANRETFPTPRSEDSECAGAHRGVPDTLTSHARLYPTPSVQDAANCGAAGPSRNALPVLRSCRRSRGRPSE